MDKKVEKALEVVTDYLLDSGSNFVGGILTDDEGNEFVVTICKNQKDSIELATACMKNIGSEANGI